MGQGSSHTGSILRSGPRSDRGQSTIEFALVIIMLMVLVFSIVEMIFFVHTYNVLADSAKEGVRYAIVHGANNPAAATDIDGPPALPGTIPGYGSGKGIVKTFAQYSLHDVSGMTVNVTYPDPATATTPSNATPNRVRVVASYQYAWFFGFGWPTITVNAAAEGRIMN
jgi:hypothetical protein